MPSVIAAVSFSASAQKIDASKVRVAATAAFAKKNPGLNAKWEKEDGKFEAGFRQDGKSMCVLLMRLEQ